VIGEKARARLANTEAELSKIVCDIAHDLGWRVYRQPVAARHPRSVKDAVGYPDLTLARNHNVLWIELKVGGNGMTVEQMQWMRDLPVVVLVTDRWSAEEVRRLLA
jgi:hypothetical protein